MSVKEACSELLTGKKGNCDRCLGCKHIGTDIFEDAHYKVSCRMYPRKMEMGKPACVIYDRVQCPWFEWDGETKLPKRKKSNVMSPVQFHQIVGPKTRMALAEILLQQYNHCKHDLEVTFRSLAVDEVTAKRLAGIIFERFDVLDATIYEPVFESLTMSCFGPLNDYDQLRVYQFNPTFEETLKYCDKDQFEAMIKELTESITPEQRKEFDIRFESAD